MILNKLLQSSTSQQSKVTIVPTNTAKSMPTKILPAPITSIQAKSSNQQSTFISSKSSVQQSPQKVIIRQVDGLFGIIINIFNFSSDVHVYFGNNYIKNRCIFYYQERYELLDIDIRATRSLKHTYFIIQLLFIMEVVLILSFLAL